MRVPGIAVHGNRIALNGDVTVQGLQVRDPTYDVNHRIRERRRLRVRTRADYVVETIAPPRCVKRRNTRVFGFYNELSLAYGMLRVDNP